MLVYFAAIHDQITSKMPHLLWELNAVENLIDFDMI